MSKKPVTLFRKIALSVWNGYGDPSVYGFAELDVTELDGKPFKLLSVVVKSLGETMSKNDELRTLIKWGTVGHRTDHCISVMVNLPAQKKDLSAVNIENSDKLSLQEIQDQIDGKAQLVRSLKDPHLGPILKMVRYTPKPLLKFLLKIYSFSIYELGLRLGISFLPHRPFGSVIISNVGSLGLKNALLPLVPIARAALMVSLGKVCEEVKVHNGQIAIRKIVHFGFTFDHRLFDGAHAGKMLQDFETAFYSITKA